MTSQGGYAAKLAGQLQVALNDNLKLKKALDQSVSQTARLLTIIDEYEDLFAIVQCVAKEDPDGRQMTFDISIADTAPGMIWKDVLAKAISKRKLINGNVTGSPEKSAPKLRTCDSERDGTLADPT